MITYNILTIVLHVTQVFEDKKIQTRDDLHSQL
jgi:hypothetical protein